MSIQKKKIAVAYVRVSTDEQKKNALSPITQERACRRKMEEDKCQILEVIKDLGKSAGNLKRAGMQRLIELIEKRQINAVYTIHSDRLTRDVSDHLKLRKLFKENDVQLVYLYQPTMENTATSRTMDTVVATFNQMHRDITSEKVLDTLTTKAREGYFPSVAPLGYKNILNPRARPEDKIGKKMVVQNPSTAPLIRELFNMYATGNYNVYELNDILYEKGLRSKHGTKLAPSRLYETLKNRFYLGEIHWGTIVTKKAKHEPLVDRAIFDRVQMVMEAHNRHACRRRKYTWLLAGFVYCRHHERRYVGGWHLGKKLAYYHCPNRSGCGKYVEQIKLENMIADKFKDLEFHPDFIGAVIAKTRAVFDERRRNYDSKRRALMSQKTAFEQRRKVIEDKLFDGTIDDATFKRHRVEIERELDSIASRMDELEDQRNVDVDVAEEILSFTRDIYKTYVKATPSLQKLYLSFFWERFEMSDGVIVKSVSSKLFDELLQLQQVTAETQNSEKSPISKEVKLTNLMRERRDLNPQPPP